MCVAEMEISGISCIISHFMKYKSTIYSNYQIPNLECVCVLCEVQEGELSAVSGFANGIFCFISSTSYFLGRATHNISFPREAINIFCIHLDLYCIVAPGSSKIISFCKLDNFSNFCCESMNEALRLAMKGTRRWKLIKSFLANLSIALKTCQSH